MEWGTKRNTQAFTGAVHKLMVLKKYVFHPASESETANEVLWTLGTTRQVLYYTQNASRHRLHSPPNLHTYIIYIVANLVPSSHRVWAHQAQPQQLVPCPLTHDEPLHCGPGRRASSAGPCESKPSSAKALSA